MERIEEIRNFICDVYTGRITSGYSDKALTYCKDLLAALAEREQQIVHYKSLVKALVVKEEQAEARVRELTTTCNAFEESFRSWAKTNDENLSRLSIAREGLEEITNLCPNCDEDEMHCHACNKQYAIAEQTLERVG